MQHDARGRRGPSATVHPAVDLVVGGRAGTSGVNAGGAGGSYQDIDNRKVDRAVASYDLPQIFNLASSYELPFGRGRQFLGTANRVLNGAVGGWRLSGNFNATSGLPLNITCPGNQLTSRCSQVGNPTAVPGGQNANHWINPAAFQPPFGGDQSFWANYDPTDPRAWQFGTDAPRLAQLRSPGRARSRTSDRLDHGQLWCAAGGHNRVLCVRAVLRCPQRRRAAWHAVR